MLRAFLRFVATVLLAASVAPAAASWCGPEGECATASEHACCDLPRLSGCTDCSSGHASNTDSEPATRISASMSMLALVPVATGTVVAADRAVAFVEDASPPRSTGDRLSLLSILIV